MDFKLIIVSFALAGLLIFVSLFATQTAEKKSHAAKLADRKELASKNVPPGQEKKKQSWMNEILSR